MRRLMIAGAAAVALSAAPAIANAQSPPTTVETSTVERQVTVTTTSELEKKSDDSSDKTGLWGLAGLLGLAGLAGLAGRHRHDDTTTPRSGTPVTGTAPPRAEGASGTTSH